MKELEIIPEKSGLYTAARIRMGFILKKEGHTGKAIELIKREIEKSSKDLEFYKFLAALYEEEGRFENAEDILKRPFPSRHRIWICTTDWVLCMAKETNIRKV